MNTECIIKCRWEIYLIIYMQAFTLSAIITQRLAEDLKIVYMRIPSFLATEHYYCINSTKWEIKIICYMH